MRTFAQKSQASSKTTSAKPATSHWTQVRQSRAANPSQHLQRAMGNQAVLRLLEANAAAAKSETTTGPALAGFDFSRIPVHAPAPGRLQTKLTLNAPGDVYEQEADRVAEQVMRMPEPVWQRPLAGGYPKPTGAQNGTARVQTKSVQANDAGGAAAPPIVHDVLRSPGQPLDATTRAFMEPRFGRDFGEVRVHADAKSAQASRALNARAFAVGNHVAFGAGQYAPGTRDGESLITHELVHTMQQASAGGGAQENLKVSRPTDAAEREADHIAAAVTDGRRAPALAALPVTASRQVIARAALKTNGGVFKVENYTESDTDKGNDTDKRVGAAIDITFTPAEAIKSDKISFVQIMKSTKDGTPYLFENEKPRATDAKSGDAGWAVDRLKDMKSANYAQENDGTAGGNTIFGYRKSKTDFKDAWMQDAVALNRSKGKTVTGDATAFALDNTGSKYLGAVSWGYATDGAGKTTKKTEAVYAMGDPTGVQKSALEKWNEQAANKDVSKRNAPDQEKVPVP